MKEKKKKQALPIDAKPDPLAYRLNGTCKNEKQKELVKNYPGEGDNIYHRTRWYWQILCRPDDRLEATT